MGRFRVNHSYMGVTSILSRLFYTDLQIRTYTMGRFRVSYSCMEVTSILSRLFYTHSLPTDQLHGLVFIK